MKLERLAGMPGEPDVCNAGAGAHWCVQRPGNVGSVEAILGPTRKDERSAIRAWNAMVRRIRKANAGEKP